jgi:ferric-dicitrate binding protein FerR (iron transport regulator)
MNPDPERVDAMREPLRNATTTDRFHADAPSKSMGHLRRAPRADDRSPARAQRLGHRAAWTAGAIVLVLLLAVSIYLVAVPTRVTVPAGQTKTVSLPDGSEIELNSGTTLRYPRWWPVDPLRAWLGRSVKLEGEAFFSVAETGTPFRVETANAEVRVLGTQFNVRTRRPNGHSETEVVVAEGHVALFAAGVTTRLDSAQTAAVQGLAPPSPSETVRVDQRIAWRYGGFSFTNASIQEIVAEVARRYNVSISVSPDAEARSLTLQVNGAEGAVPLLRDVCRVAGCRIDSTASELVVRPR